MKDIFPEYYQPEGDDFAKLWNECLFVFDANILLDLYRYSESSREDMLSLLEHERIAPRVWIPHHAAYEYQKNRTAVVFGKQSSYEKLEAAFKDNLKALINAVLEQGKEINKLKGAPPIVDIEVLITPIEVEVAKVSEQLGEERAKVQGEGDDKIRQRIDNLFAGKVGKPFDDTEIKTICAEGKLRFARNTPPGFVDYDKKLNDARAQFKTVDSADETNLYNQFGDLIVWKQSLEELAKEETKSVILVTGDGKDDWLLKVKGRTVGPHPELIREALDVTSKALYIYSLDAFYRRAKEYIKQDVRLETVAEVEAYSEMAEIVFPKGLEDYVWHTVQTNASAQMKAFLLPASFVPLDDGHTALLIYDASQRFHMAQLANRTTELRDLIYSVTAVEVAIQIVGLNDSGEVAHFFDSEQSRGLTEQDDGFSYRHQLFVGKSGEHFAKFPKEIVEKIWQGRVAEHVVFGRGIVIDVTAVQAGKNFYALFRPDKDSEPVILALGELTLLE